MERYAKLAQPFDLSEIQLKVQATNKDRTRGMVVAYIDARAVIDRLDEVVGPEGWHDTYEVLTNTTQDGVRLVEVLCRLTIGDVYKEDVGEGDSMKAAFSDALKRAAVKFGIGRYLYRLPKVWAELDQYGNIKDPEGVKAQLFGGKPAQREQAQAQDTKPAQSLGGARISDKQIALIKRLAREIQEDATDEDIADLVSAGLGREVNDLSSLTMKEASEVIKYLQELKASF